MTEYFFLYHFLNLTISQIFITVIAVYLENYYEDSQDTELTFDHSYEIYVNIITYTSIFTLVTNLLIIRNPDEDARPKIGLHEYGLIRLSYYMHTFGIPVMIIFEYFVIGQNGQAVY
jgi:hypothetical protein